MSPKKATPLAKSLLSWTSLCRFFSLLPLMGNVSSPVTAESGCMPAKWQWFCKSPCNLLHRQDIYIESRNAQFVAISVGAFAW